MSTHYDIGYRKMGKWDKIHKIQNTQKYTNIHKTVTTIDWVAGIK